jgi:hypothetical protein
MAIRKKHQYRRISYGICLSLFMITPTLASSCSNFPANMKLPLSVGATLTLNAQGGAGSNSTDQTGGIGLGSSNITVTFKPKIKTMSLVFSTTNPSNQVVVSVYKGTTQLRKDNYSVRQSLLTLVVEPTDDADQVLIEGVPQTNDTHLLLACGE